MRIPKNLPLIRICILAVLTFAQSCIDPVEPDFDFQDNLIFIEAYALTEPGISSVSIKRSIYDGRNYYLGTVSNAQVKIENVNTGDIVEFLEDSTGVYLCPANFATAVGEAWKMTIELEDGRRFESKSEVVSPSIPIDNVVVEYSSEVKFDVGFDRFIPGHSIRIDWRDPPGERNFYLWQYRSYEPLYVCKTCENGILRNGVCQTISSNFFTRDYDYLCVPDCWKIRYGEELPLFDDRLSDGASITDREIAIIPYYRRQDILVEIQQLSLNESAYEYYKIIDDLINENSGLNAPPPAALLGNIFDPTNTSEVVLGHFTAAAVSTERIFIERTGILETPITPDPSIIIEDCASCPVSYPCMEGLFRTPIKPEGWP